MARPKISLIGAGQIGGVQAQLIAQRQLADVVLFDPDSVEDRATYEEPCVPAAGIHTLFVNGQPVPTLNLYDHIESRWGLAF